MNHPPLPVRILRLTGPRRRWVLDDGTGLYDLSEFLRQSGRPDDLFELAQDGWFGPEQLEAKLPRSGNTTWQPIEAGPDGLPKEGLGLPLARESVGKILALGKNFRAHAEEFHEAVPEEPLFFNKLPETLVPSGTPVKVPGWYRGRVDHEVELAVVIGLKGRDISIDDAMEYVAFYTLANDLTARSLQGSDRKLGYPWFRAKNMDGFCPLGPALVPQGYLDPNNVALTASVGSEVRQSANTSDLVVTIPEAIAYLSRHLTLHPGDLILMGTPSGVGALEHGDVVICRGEPIGTLTTPIERPESSR
ncbi:MAG: fumarylacetoacetate hydrolase family protein [Planctomycetes bacterium]|nr:fumarylacetoacetate hydrolase family protein [Planctomycetota bacterium]MCB9910125.1 fumarylacetoacetate hydrolase family protein [Planctomycetota bacterium]MCB9913108.1 fumarylacetoacetate hydrolase family protein [Planctomycetota bacterium]HPF13462.1 fumarylacetoacetate hydrolase family protein [Planctomycetota bacterium]